MPIVKSSGAVSPAARATASSAPLTIPAAACGSTTVRIVRDLAAPERVAALAQLARHELQHLLGGPDHDRQHQACERERAGEAVLLLNAAPTACR